MVTTFSWTTPTGTVVPLDGSAGVSLLLPILGLDAPPLTWGLEDRLAYDGTVAFRVRAEERPISLPLLIDTDDISMSAVVRMFAPITDTLTGVVIAGGTLTATTGGVSRTLENVIYESGFEGEYSATAGGGGLPWRQVTLNLNALDPYWFGPLNSQVLNIGAVTAFDDATVLFDASTTPFDGGNSTAVPVAGDTFSFPIFVINGPFSTLILDGPETSESIRLAAPLADLNQIVIDGTPGNRGPKLNGGLVDWSLISAGSRIFPLGMPSATVSISGTGTGGNSSVEMRWRNRYMTPAP